MKKNRTLHKKDFIKKDKNMPKIILGLIIILIFVVAYGEHYSNIQSEKLYKVAIANIANQQKQEVKIEKEKVVVVKNISCWGDSMTQGDGSNGYPYPTVLAELLNNNTVNRFGVGGESSLYIASRQGGLPIYVQPCTIPKDSTPVSIVLKNENGENIEFGYINGLMSGVNPCSVNGVEGTLSYKNGLNFIRTTPGDSVTISKATLLITEAMKNHKDDIAIIWAGTNDRITQNGTKNTFTNIDAMINYANHDQYIVIGMTSLSYMPNVADINIEFKKKYGNHFLDIRQYLLKNGLKDAKIAPTAKDTTEIASGEIPTSLRSDDVHLSQIGCKIVAQQVDKFGQVLGYWD